MKELSKYQCEYCNTEYRNKSGAEDCERNHKLPIGQNEAIMKMKFNAMNSDKSGYPKSLNIKFNNGEVITYNRG